MLLKVMLLKKDKCYWKWFRKREMLLKVIQKEKCYWNWFRKREMLPKMTQKEMLLKVIQKEKCYWNWFRKRNATESDSERNATESDSKREKCCWKWFFTSFIAGYRNSLYQLVQYNHVNILTYLILEKINFTKHLYIVLSCLIK